MTKQYFVYIMSNGYRKNPTLYIGVTNCIERRVFEHKNKSNKGFTREYNLDKLVYLENCSSAYDAISRENQLKNWHREWKLNLIREHNPRLEDLAREIPKLVRNDSK